ncbi:si:dkey-261l7.2 [Callorhinchus milii]|uniref:Uncharacterized LOC103188427 n=1 Tax=Callorhinchus milii TaxID=7868 RepID=V9L5I2_CALMI|nr:si:dkey-261l7.2 [Callorhinchus milii]XP_007906617.1 si:dkey-261l7.2 [Callorhinchus milii]|eukprot:gi/632979699/ref/XP_007906615.1/ PREDICTED: uncharacterized protein LOC103188427 [Callorhinchus milii]
MPQLTPAIALQIGLLISALPAQYLLSRWSGSDRSQRIQASRRLLNTWNQFRKSYFNLQAWKDWLQQWLVNARLDHDDDLAESPAVEVFLLREKKSYFGGSPDPRSPKPSHVKYRVGQVIRHLESGFRGVIVGWDASAKAPEDWIQENYSPNEQHLRNTPHYKVLIHSSDQRSQATAYVAEEQLVIITGVQVHHPHLETYFRMFDGAQYLMNPWLKKMYPHD